MRSFPEAYNEIHIFEYQHFFPKKPAFDGGTNLRLSARWSLFFFILETTADSCAIPEK